MGQKTNPNLFRLAINSNFLANWYSSKINYSLNLQEDNIYRQKICEIIDPFFTMATIHTSRKESANTNFIYFNLTLLYPKEKEFLSKLYKNFSNKEDFFSKEIMSILSAKKNDALNLKFFVTLILAFLKQKMLNSFDKSKNLYFFKVNFIKNPYTHPVLTAKYIAEQLSNRIPFRRVMKQALENAKYSSIKGMMIELSGRLNGVEMARTEKKKWGTVPLHTLRASVLYAQHEVNTVYGIIGIKVWIYL